MTTTNKLNALILVGGKSTRMKTDKGKLNYHGVEQVKYLQKILKDKVEEVFISIREEQQDLAYLNDIPQIKDQFESIGPICGILSAFQTIPDSSWLVMAIDLPHADEDTVNQLIQNYDPNMIATCFINPEKEWAEPLFSIYSPRAFEEMKDYYLSGSKCPRKFLKHREIKAIRPINEHALVNANTPEEYQKALADLKEGK